MQYLIKFDKENLYRVMMIAENYLMLGLNYQLEKKKIFKGNNELIKHTNLKNMFKII
jgi:hypothetical protein